VDSWRQCESEQAQLPQPNVLGGACCSSRHEVVFPVLLTSATPQLIVFVLLVGTASHSFPVVPETMGSTASHSSTPLRPPSPSTAPAAPYAAAEVCPRCGGAPHCMQPDASCSHYVQVSICVGPGAGPRSPNVIHWGDGVWQLTTRCGCVTAACSHSTGRDRVIIPAGARVWFECPCCGLLFGSVADFGRHDCASERGGGVGESSESAASGVAASRA